jgi:hypothetical protein
MGRETEGDLGAGSATRRMPVQGGTTNGTQPAQARGGATGTTQPSFTPAGTQPSFTPAGATQPGVGSARGNRESRGAGGSRRAVDPGRAGWGSLRGGLGVSIVLASAVIGVVATLVIGHGPGSVLGLFIMVGTVVAALAVRPTAVRMLLPVPALCYVIAALAVGLVTEPPSDASKAALAVAAAQWIAAGFLTMILATALAVVLTLVRWFLWHHSRPVPDGPARSARSGSRRRRRVSREDVENPDPYGPYGTPVSLGSQGAMGNYGVYESQAGTAAPGFGTTGGLGGQGGYRDTGGLGGQGGYRDTGGLGGRGDFETGALGDPGGYGSQGGYGGLSYPDGYGGQGRYGDTGGGQDGYGNADGPGGVRRAGRWGDPGAPDPGSRPDALRAPAAAVPYNFSSGA